MSREQSRQPRPSSVTRLAELVEPEAVELQGGTSPEGAVTIMFTDIEGSTEMVERLGDEQWVRILRVHNRLVRETVARNAGTEVKSQGDGFMLAFLSSRAALRCAIDMQRTFASHGEMEGEHRIGIRIGVHSGFMIQEGDDYIGRNVILASRIADSAAGGEILVSGELREFVEPAEPAPFLEPRALELKGLSGTHVVHPVDWRSA